MYAQTFTHMTKQLEQLDLWLEAAQAFAQSRSFESKAFLDVRLAPDQFPLVRQVQATCDVAKLAAARLAGREAPKHPDTEATMEELRARVRSVIEYLGSFGDQDFESAAGRVITQPRWEGRVMDGGAYFLQHAVPNFYFHLVHTYALLRSNGVNLGKRDYLGKLDLRTP